MPQNPNPRRKSDAARRANQVVRSRTVLIMLALGVVTFGILQRNDIASKYVF